MGIKSVDSFECRVNYTHGVYTMSHGRSGNGAPSTVVRIWTDKGLHGWGEICPNGSAFYSDWTEPAVSTTPTILSGGGTGRALTRPGLGVTVDVDALGKLGVTVSAEPTYRPVAALPDDDDHAVTDPITAGAS